MNGMRADISNFQHPIMSKRPLNGEVPLLRVGSHKFARHHQTEKELRRNYARPRSAARIIRSTGSVSTGKTLKSSQARNKSRIKCSRSRQRVGIRTARKARRRRRKERGQTSWRPASKRYRQKRRLERKLVRRADIFAYVINAVAAANGGGVMTEQVIRQTNAGPNTSRIIVRVSGIISGSCQSREVQALYATTINKRVLPAVG